MTLTMKELRADYTFEELAKKYFDCEQKLVEAERERQELETEIKDLNREIGRAYNAGRKEQDEIAYREGLRDGREQR